MRLPPSCFRSFTAALIALGVALLAGTTPLPAQTLSDLTFSHYTVDDGLSQGTIYSLLHDRKGFMWIGTQDGLNRFDGYDFRTFKNDPRDPGSLSNNWVWCLHQDSSAMIWAGTFGGGLNRFDPRTERFTVFRAPDTLDNRRQRNSIRAILEQPAGTLWLGCDYGFARFDSRTGDMQFLDLPETLGNVTAVLPRDAGSLWLLALGRLVVFDIATESIRRIDPIEPATPNFLVMSRGADGLWIGSTDAGLWRYDGAGLRPAATGLAEIGTMLNDARGWLWVGTQNGLYVGRDTPGQPLDLARYIYRPDDPDGLTNSTILSLGHSRDRAVWVGTRAGLLRYDPHQRKFTRYRPLSDGRESGLSFHLVNPILETKGEILWVGTARGLNRFDLSAGGPIDTAPVTWFFADPADPEGSLSSSYILSLCEDSDGNLWVGTRRGGISRLHAVDGTVPPEPRISHFRNDPGDPGSVGSNNINALYQDRGGVIWAGGGGLNRYQPESGTFHRYRNDPDDPASINHNHVFVIYEDRAGGFWVGTASGLHRFDRDTGRFVRYTADPADSMSLSNDIVLSIHQSPRDGALWVGTASGLNRVVPPAVPGDSGFHFITWREGDGLPNDCIYGILEDDHGRLWMSTNKGVVRFDPAATPPTLRAFTVDDGLQGDEFNQNAFCRTVRGEMFFGGTNGLNHFHPDSIRDNPYLPPLVFTRFQILNQSVPIAATLPEGRTSPLPVAISEAKTIRLGHRDDVISLEFAALNFTHSEKNRYAYRMEGFDDGWIESGTRRFVTYTNLDPGDYVFRVRAANNDGVWNPRPTELRLHIAPPPWQTWWAWLIYAMLAVAMVAGIVQLRVRTAARRLEEAARIERARLEEREEVRRKSSADFHDEAGNVLTKITLFLEMARRSADGQTRLLGFLDKIEENAATLSSGMRDFIWILDPDQDSLFDTLERLRGFGDGLFEHSAIRFHSDGLADRLRDVVLDIDDRRAILLVFKEAMNNCLKYSQAAAAHFGVALDGEGLEVYLRDDGRGFDPAATGDGYGLGNMRRRAEKIGAHLTIESAPGAGTTVRLRRPLSAAERTGASL